MPITEKSSSFYSIKPNWTLSPIFSNFITLQCGAKYTTTGFKRLTRLQLQLLLSVLDADAHCCFRDGIRRHRRCMTNAAFAVGRFYISPFVAPLRILNFVFPESRCVLLNLDGTESTPRYKPVNHCSAVNVKLQLNTTGLS